MRRRTILSTSTLSAGVLRMARGSAVEYEAVATACAKLFLAGESVSLPRVYDAIGNRGSSRIVQEMIKRWRRETADKLAITVTRNLPGVPEDLTAGADDWLVKFWQGALAQAEQTYLRARGELDAERAELEAERQRNAATLHDLDGQVRETRATLQERDQALGDLKGASQDQDVRLREREAQVASLREEVARVTATLDAIQRQCASDLAAAQARSEEILAETRRQHAIEIEREREQAAGERNFLISTTDQLRTAARTTETEMRSQLDHAKTMSEGYRQRAHRAEAESSRWQGRAEAAEALLTAMTTKRKRREQPAAQAGH